MRIKGEPRLRIKRIIGKASNDLHQGLDYCQMLYMNAASRYFLKLAATLFSNKLLALNWYYQSKQQKKAFTIIEKSGEVSHGTISLPTACPCGGMSVRQSLIQADSDPIKHKRISHSN